MRAIGILNRTGLIPSTEPTFSGKRLEKTMQVGMLLSAAGFIGGLFAQPLLLASNKDEFAAIKNIKRSQKLFKDNATPDAFIRLASNQANAPLTEDFLVHVRQVMKEVSAVSGEPTVGFSLGRILPELQMHPEALDAANHLAKEALKADNWTHFEQSIFPRFVDEVLGKVEKNPQKLQLIEQSAQEAFQRLNHTEKTRKGMLGVMLASVLLWGAIRLVQY